MGDKIPLTPEQTIKLDGYFDMQKTYRAIKTYLDNNRHYDLSEKEFNEKNNGSSRNLFIYTQGDLYFTDWLKIVIVYKLYLNGDDVELEVDGKTKKYTKGSGKLEVFMYGDADYMEKRKSSPFLTFVGKLYDKFFNADEIKKLKKKAKVDSEGLIKIFKQQFHGKVF